MENSYEKVILYQLKTLKHLKLNETLENVRYEITDVTIGVAYE